MDLEDRLPADAEDALVVDVPGPAGPVRVRVWPALDVGTKGQVLDGVRPVRRARGRRGESGRPVLVAFHGWTDSGEVFGPLARALGRQWTVVAPDAPGHGGTPWRGGRPYAMDDQVPNGVAVLDALPVVAGRRAPVVVLGHSMGAVPAAGVAAARARNVRHVVLEDPVRVGLRPGERNERLRRLLELRPLDLPGRVAAGRAEHPGWPEDELLAWARAKGEVDVDHLRVPTAWGEPLADRLTGVRCPVTLVRGVPERGGFLSSVAARRVAAACPAGCEVIALNAGHSVRRDARAPFAATLASVLARYEPAASGRTRYSSPSQR